MSLKLALAFDGWGGSVARMGTKWGSFSPVLDLRTPWHGQEGPEGVGGGAGVTVFRGWGVL